MATKENKEVVYRNAKPKDKPYKLTDGKGMFLLVNPDGGKYWRLAYRFNGKQKTLALGAYPDVSLDKAREKRTAARSQLDDGFDPGQVKKQNKLASQGTGSQYLRKDCARNGTPTGYPHGANQRPRTP